MIKKQYINAVIVLLLFLCLSVSLRECYLHRQNEIKAREILQGLSFEATNSRADSVLVVFRYVYNNVKLKERRGAGFFRNDVIRILDDGGICGDYVRLMIILLHQIGIPANRVNITDFDYTQPPKIKKEELGHVSLEVELGQWYWAIFDPHLKVYFKDLSGKFLTRKDLTSVSAMDKYIVHDVPYFPDFLFVYTYKDSRLLNWDKMPILNLIPKVLGLFMSKESLNRIPTPYILERPHLTKAILFGFLTLILGLTWIYLRRRTN
jgi:hypothetical protein